MDLNLKIFILNYKIEDNKVVDKKILEDKKNKDDLIANIAKVKFAKHDKNASFLESFQTQMRWVCRFDALAKNMIPEEWVKPNSIVTHIKQAQKDDMIEKALRETFAFRSLLIDNRRLDDEESDDDDCSESSSTSNKSDFSRYKSDTSVPEKTYDQDLPNEKNLREFLTRVVHENQIWDLGLQLQLIRDMKQKHKSYFWKDTFCPCGRAQKEWLNHTKLIDLQEQVFFFKNRLCKNATFQDNNGFVDHLYSIGVNEECLVHYSLFYYIYYMYEEQVKFLMVHSKIKKLKKIDKKVCLKFIPFELKYNIHLKTFGITR